MQMKKGIEKIRREFSEKNYTLLTEEYKNLHISRFDFICNKHQSYGIQNVSYQSFGLNKNNCKECISDNLVENWSNYHPKREFDKPKYFNKYSKKVYAAVGDEYTIIDIHQMISSYKIILKLLHNDCNSIYEVEQHKFLKGNHRCQNPKCKHERFSTRMLKSQQQICEEICDVSGNEYTVAGKYAGTHENLKLIHNVCGNHFYMHPHNFLSGQQRCPHCTTPTKGEQRIIEYLQLNNISYVFQKSFDDLVGINNGKLSYDIFLDELNILIEYQGQFHDGTAYKMDIKKYKRQQEHDRRKREYAKSNNIKLLEIWYWDFDNIESILFNYIK